MTATETRLRVGAIDLYVRLEGGADEPTLLFLHGLTNSTEASGWIVPQLTDRYRVVSFDFRGHGRSDRAGHYVTPDFLDDAVTVCEQVAGSGAVVIAHSFGGLIGAALAQQRPDLARALFLEDPLLVDPGVRTDLLGDDGAYAREVFAGAEDFLALMAQWRRDGLSVEEAASLLGSMPTPHGVTFSEAYFPESVRAMAEYRMQFDTRIFDDFVAAQGSREAEPVFDHRRPIDVPGFLLAGDPSIPGVRARLVDIERLEATSPKFDHQTVKGAGHFIHDERNSRAAYTEALMAFLSGLRS